MQKNRKTVNVKSVNIQQAAEEFYLSNKAKGLAEATCEVYKIYITSFIHWYGISEDLYNISVSTFESYVLFKANSGVKMVSIASQMKHIRRFINFCVERGYTEKVNVLIPKYEKTLKEPYTDEEMSLLLARPQTNSWIEWRNWAMVNYFFSTGQRLSSALNIKVKDLDLEAHTVKLDWNKDKNQKIMPLSSAVVLILKEYMELSELEEDEYLFPQSNGEQLQRRGAEDAIASYNHSRGVQKTSIHLFRHCFAKNYIVNGGNPMKLQKLLKFFCRICIEETC